MLAISDIHGHKRGFRRLLAEAQYSPGNDQLVMLGDYIDADNPATWDTLELVRELTELGADAIPGNQELKLLAFTKNRGKGRGVIPGKQRQYAKWIRSLPISIIDRGILFVHAGIRPGISLMKQSIRDMTEIREPFLFCPLHELGAQIDGDDSNVPEPQWRTVMFGHTPTFKLGAAPGCIWSDERRVALDTGAKHAQRLTLLDVSGSIAYSCATYPNYQSDDFRMEPVFLTGGGSSV